MRSTAIVAALFLSSAPAWAGPFVGKYVEARTAEVFAGGCIMSSSSRARPLQPVAGG